MGWRLDYIVFSNLPSSKITSHLWLVSHVLVNHVPKQGTTSVCSHWITHATQQRLSLVHALPTHIIADKQVATGFPCKSQLQVNFGSPHTVLKCSCNIPSSFLSHWCFHSVWHLCTQGLSHKSFAQLCQPAGWLDRLVGIYWVKCSYLQTEFYCESLKENHGHFWKSDFWLLSLAPCIGIVILDFAFTACWATGPLCSEGQKN